MRRNKPDASQAAIVDGLIAAGCSWQPIYPVQGGEPDGLCGHRGRNVLMEIKSSNAARNRKRGKTVDKQKAWAMKWRGGPVHVVVTLEEALTVMGLR